MNTLTPRPQICPRLATSSLPNMRMESSDLLSRIYTAQPYTLVFKSLPRLTPYCTGISTLWECRRRTAHGLLNKNRFMITWWICASPLPEQSILQRPHRTTYLRPSPEVIFSQSMDTPQVGYVAEGQTPWVDSAGPRYAADGMKASLSLLPIGSVMNHTTIRDHLPPTSNNLLAYSRLVIQIHLHEDRFWQTSSH